MRKLKPIEIKKIELELKKIESDLEKKVVPEKNQISFFQELLRKSIHVFSLAIPISFLFVEKSTSLFILSIVMLALVIPDIIRKYSKRLNSIILFFFGNMLRPKERKNKAILNGASWVIINAVLILIIFPQYIASVSLSILIVCDLFAALIGRRFGRHRIYNKSLEGTLAYCISGFIVIFIYYTMFTPSLLFAVAGFIAVVVSSIVELTAKEYKVDDNFAIPFTVATILWVANSLFADAGMGFAYIL